MEENYVYAYLDPRSEFDKECFDVTFFNVPFYIGRGKKDRAFHHLKEAKKFKGCSLEIAKQKRLNLLKINKINSIVDGGFEPIIIFIKKDLSLTESQQLESKLISFFGKMFDGSGVLTNITDGGENVTKHIMSGPFNPFYKKTHSKQTKEKLSQIHSGKIISEEHKNKISEKLKGKSKSRQAKENYRSSMRKRFIENPNQDMFQVLGKSKMKKWKIKSSSGQILIIESLLNFCKENNLNSKTLLSAFTADRLILTGPSANWQILEQL